MASFAMGCSRVMILGLLLLAADNFGSVHGLRTRQYHIHMLHADDSLPSNRVVTSNMDEMEWKLNSGRNLLQRDTPNPSIRPPIVPSVGPPTPPAPS